METYESLGNMFRSAHHLLCAIDAATNHGPIAGPFDGMLADHVNHFQVAFNKGDVMAENLRRYCQYVLFMELCKAVSPLATVYVVQAQDHYPSIVWAHFCNLHPSSQVLRHILFDALEALARGTLSCVSHLHVRCS